MEILSITTTEDELKFKTAAGDFLPLTIKGLAQLTRVRPDVAVVHVNGHRNGPTKELIQDAIINMVMVKEKEGWSITAFQNTAVAPRP